MEINLNAYSEPTIYYRDGKKCYLDVVKNCLRPATPEEYVRQKLLLFLHNEMEIPFNALDTEVNLSYYKKGLKGRIDVTVNVLYEDFQQTQMVIECKAKNVDLTEEVFSQADAYATKINAPIIMLTNGIEAEIYVWDLNQEEYNYLDYYPSYNDILDMDNLTLEPIPEYKYTRYSYNDLIKNKTINYERKENYWIDELTDENLVPYIINLAESFLDYSHNMGKIKLKNFDLEDLGVRFANFSNPRGAQWVGHYRCFKITDNINNTQLINLMVQVSSNGRSYLVVGLDDFGKHNPTLYLSLNHFIDIKNNKVEIFHNGAMTIGKGAAKRDRVLNYINKHSNLKILNKKIYLGCLDASNLIYVDNEDFKKFLENLIIYVLTRESLKDIIREERKQQ